MTAGFVMFAAGMGCYAYALRATLPGPSWVAAALTGVATLGVAAFPLHHSSPVDALHGAWAGIGYATLAATALLAARPLAYDDQASWSSRAVIAGTASAVALACTLAGWHEGFFQRLGLTTGDAWVVASVVAIRRGSWTRAAHNP